MAPLNRNTTLLCLVSEIARFLGSAMGIAIANRKNRCDFGALRRRRRRRRRRGLVVLIGCTQRGSYSSKGHASALYDTPLLRTSVPTETLTRCLSKNTSKKHFFLKNLPWAIPPVRLVLSRRNSRKIPERPRKHSRSVSWNSPREYGWDPPNPIIHGIWGFQRISRTLSPPVRLGTPLLSEKWFRRGPLRAVVMEFPAVLGAFLILRTLLRSMLLHEPHWRAPILSLPQAQAKLLQGKALYGPIPVKTTHEPATEQKKPHEPQNRQKIPARHTNSAAGDRKNTPKIPKKYPENTNFRIFLSIPGGIWRGILGSLMFCMLGGIFALRWLSYSVAGRGVVNNTGQDWTFWRTFRTIGPYQFREKFIWTNHWSIPFRGETRMDQWSWEFLKSFSLDWYWSMDGSSQPSPISDCRVQFGRPSTRRGCRICVTVQLPVRPRRETIWQCTGKRMWTMYWQANVMLGRDCLRGLFGKLFPPPLNWVKSGFSWISRKSGFWQSFDAFWPTFAPKNPLLTHFWTHFSPLTKTHLKPTLSANK